MQLQHTRARGKGHTHVQGAKVARAVKDSIKANCFGNFSDEKFHDVLLHGNLHVEELIVSFRYFERL